MFYDDECMETTLVNVSDDECMKINAPISLIVICERNLGLCHKDILKIGNYRDLIHSVCTYTSGYFPFYNDEYG